MFILPTFIVYIYFENPSISFYLISLFMTFLIPIIPTIISSIIGYIIKLFSSKSKRKKIVQTLLSSIVFLVIFFLSMTKNCKQDFFYISIYEKVRPFIWSHQFYLLRYQNNLY